MVSPATPRVYYDRNSGVVVGPGGLAPPTRWLWAVRS